MKIAVVAANGRVAKKVIAEALSRGHEVVAFGRHAENDTPAKKYVQKDLFDLTREDLAGFDAVVDAAGAWSPETFPIIPNAAKHLAGILAGEEFTLNSRNESIISYAIALVDEIEKGGHSQQRISVVRA
ncbi:MAG: NAD(P)H-binding protein [Selenomonas sp.]|nr:NAD(P)H-binding protein [Selenomonas sp.]